MHGSVRLPAVMVGVRDSRLMSWLCLSVDRQKPLLPGVSCFGVSISEGVNVSGNTFKTFFSLSLCILPHDLHL